MEWALAVNYLVMIAAVFSKPDYSKFINSNTNILIPNEMESPSSNPLLTSDKQYLASS